MYDTCEALPTLPGSDFPRGLVLAGDPGVGRGSLVSSAVCRGDVDVLVILDEENAVGGLTLALFRNVPWPAIVVGPRASVHAYVEINV